MAYRPFNFKFCAAEFFTELQKIEDDAERGRWAVQLATDLITLIPKTEYGKLLISQTFDLINKRSESGKLGGRPPKNKGFDLVSQDKSEQKPKSKPEKEPEKETAITTTTTPVVVDQNDIFLKARVLLTAWPEAATAVAAVTAAISQHGLEFTKAQITYSKKNAKANPSAYLQAAMQGDFAGFYAAAEARDAVVAAKQAKAELDAVRQAEEDAKLPPVTAKECFSIFNQLEAAT